MATFSQFQIPISSWVEKRRKHKFSKEEEIRETLQQIALCHDVEKLDARQRTCLYRSAIACAHALQSPMWDAGKAYEQEAEAILLNFEFWKETIDNQTCFTAARGIRGREQRVKSTAKYCDMVYFKGLQGKKFQGHRVWEHIYHSASLHSASPLMLTVADSYSWQNTRPLELTSGSLEPVDELQAGASPCTLFFIKFWYPELE